MNSFSSEKRHRLMVGISQDKVRRGMERERERGELEWEARVRSRGLFEPEWQTSPRGHGQK